MVYAEYPLSTRLAAVKAWWWARCNVRAAVAKFKELVPRRALRPPDGVAVQRFIRRWATRFDSHGSVAKKKPPGRRPALTVDEARRALFLLAAGYYRGRGHFHYRSIQAAIAHSAEIRELASRYKAASRRRSFYRRLKANAPALHRRLLRYVRKLTPKTKQARLAYCWRMRMMKPGALQRYLARVVWVDSKLEYVGPRDHLVYATAGECLRQPDPRVPTGHADIHKINYYAAVCRAFGVCLIKICTGTTDYATICKTSKTGLRTYKVGGLWAPASNAYDGVCHTKLQWGFASTVFTACFIMLPHHLWSA